VHLSRYLGLALLGLAGAANADAVSWADNFNADAGGTSTLPAGWTVTGGTVDVIGAGTSWDFGLGASHGKFIDLDGSSGAAGTLSRQLALQAGTQYLLSFDLAGSQRAGYDQGNLVNVGFGSSHASYNLATFDSFQTHSLLFTAASSGMYSISFANQGGDNVGALLDNVSVSAVPEPESYALMLAGLGALALVQRRRNRRG
jgi:hypothetical protein